MTDQAERAFRKAAEAFRRYGDDRGLARAAWGAAECSFILRPDDAPSQLDDLREASGRAAAAHDHEGLALVQIAMSFALWKGHKRQDALAHLAGANQALMDQPYAAALARLAERTAEIHAGTDPELTRSRFADAEGKWRELGATEHADRLKARSEA